MPAANILPAANALTLSGATLQVISGSNAASSQTFASTALNTGLSVVSGISNPVVNLGTITANAGGVIEFIGPATVGSWGNVASNANITTTAIGNAAFIGTGSAPFSSAIYATVGLLILPRRSGSVHHLVIGGSQVSGFYTSASGGSPASGGNLDVVGNITGWSTQSLPDQHPLQQQPWGWSDHRRRQQGHAR